MTASAADGRMTGSPAATIPTDPGTPRPREDESTPDGPAAGTGVRTGSTGHRTGSTGHRTGSTGQPPAARTRSHGQPAGPHGMPSLSPSRAADFKTCPLLYRFRTIDRLPETPTADQARGTLVHAVLERLFDLPAPQRTPAAAAGMVAPQWQRLVSEQPELAGLFGEVAAATPGEFLASAGDLLRGYFEVEDPRRLQPAERECLVSVEVPAEEVTGGRLLLRGYIDRLDVAPTGDIRVVDYKTGGAPREAFEARALFQLKFYALVLWRTRGVVPRVLRLLYLRDAEACDYTPDVEELTRFERNLVALCQAIERATRAQDFRPKPSRLCGWCAHQAYCPAYGGTPPPFPVNAGTTVVAAPVDIAGRDE